jgi:DNA invertase Pin-like site-specific DNA recombinase
MKNRENKIYGYVRISTMKQSIERQIRNIKAEYPEAIIVTDKYTGTTIDRPEWNKLYKKLKAGDRVVFDSVSRMSRNAVEGFELYEELYNKGVELEFIKEPHINTATYKKALDNNMAMTGTSVDYILEGVNKYLMALAKEQIMIAFEQAEKEVKDLHQRTLEGLETARLNGKQIGRAKGQTFETKKSKEMKQTILRLSKDFGNGGTNKDTEVMAITGLSRNTYYKYKSELKAAVGQ